ncbi:PREDICTED: pyridoxine-5'-phosphate oxidase isoform X2 [Diuraphis noxia]|uniref:pyridoxine-5'-phosphate oxidase isoform X2 n=1 Tax=Diuraphis noxia TaxID=143948 RepID=UPI000763B412|nr:PREDICTED: pyridoxine-5'-phosphate oxidase isoform X2 [Diuraphis noxia]XP_015372130.1 PREDICTED: pyridoxine-5'-phosphate oxidase isoform X2 [Diuraphis noxia]
MIVSSGQNLWKLYGRVRRLSTAGPIRMADSSIAQLRVSYRDKGDVLLEDNLESKNPHQLFSIWFKKASERGDVRQPNAACLATATKSGIPSARFVLLKGFDESGYTFFTNSESRKGREIEENPVAAMTIYWDALDRSVRIEGAVEKIDETESTKYFDTRPKSSQIGAHVSRQSTVIDSRKSLLEQNEKLEVEFAEKRVPRPSYWNGYKIIPKTMEFWQGQSDRLHDRIVFERADQAAKKQITSHAGENGWVFYRLSP